MKETYAVVVTSGKMTQNQYIALHQWVKYHRGRPRLCEECGTTEAKMYGWANISGEYKRDLSDWRRLCQKCHLGIDFKKRVRLCHRKLHLMTPENSYIYPDGRGKMCRACRAVTNAQWKRKRRAMTHQTREDRLNSKETI